MVSWKSTAGALLLAAAVAGCNEPRPEGVSGCNGDYYTFTRAVSELIELRQVPDYIAERVGAGHPTFYEDLIDAIRQMPAGTPRQPRYLNVLVLSGGGQWGAYGAGFLNGWRQADGAGRDYKSEVPYPRQQRSDIDIVAAISIGASQTPAAYVGSTTDSDVAKGADKSLTDQFLGITQDDLLRQRFGGQAAALLGNSIYSVSGLEARSSALVDTMSTE